LPKLSVHPGIWRHDIIHDTIGKRLTVQDLSPC
jgi:hypothetical protein